MIMPVYGNMRIPRARLGLLLDHLIVLNQMFYQDGFDKNQFISALGLSPKSSGPDHKISDMIMFGLLIKGEADKKISITDLGRKIIASTGTERENAILSAVKGVPLWEKLWESFGKDVENENFSLAVKTLTGIPDEDITKKVEEIRFAYGEDINCITKSPPFSIWTRNTGRQKKSLEQYEKPLYQIAVVESQAPLINESQRSMPIQGYRISSDYAGFQIEIKDANTYAVALQILESIKQELVKQGVRFEEKTT